MSSLALIVMTLALLNPGAPISVDGNRITLDQQGDKYLYVINEKEGKPIQTEVVALKQLYGKWKNSQGEIWEFTAKGELLQDNVKAGTFVVLDSKTIKYYQDAKGSFVSYQLDGSKLKWGDQQLERVK